MHTSLLFFCCSILFYCTKKTGARKGGLGSARAQQRSLQGGRVRVQSLPGAADGVLACRGGASHRSRTFLTALRCVTTPPVCPPNAVLGIFCLKP